MVVGPNCTTQIALPSSRPMASATSLLQRRVKLPRSTISKHQSGGLKGLVVAHRAGMCDIWVGGPCGRCCSRAVATSGAGSWPAAPGRHQKELRVTAAASGARRVTVTATSPQPPPQAPSAKSAGTRMPRKAAAGPVPTWRHALLWAAGSASALVPSAGGGSWPPSRLCAALACWR